MQKYKTELESKKVDLKKTCLETKISYRVSKDKKIQFEKECIQQKREIQQLEKEAETKEASVLKLKQF